MKRLLTICFLLAMTFNTKAQKLSFEETVAYIKSNTVEKCRYSYTEMQYSKEMQYTTVMTYDVKINIDGIITFIRMADKDLKRIYPDLTFNIQNILKIVLDENDTKYIRFYSSNNSFYLISTDSQTESEKLVKAFNHLKTLCTKEKDPFKN